MATATPHPTVTTFLRWADLCVAICGDRIEPAAARIAIEAARFRTYGRTAEFRRVDCDAIAKVVCSYADRYEVHTDSGSGPAHSIRYQFGALTAVALFDGEGSRAYIATSNPIAEVLTVGS
jgi:hypothetical protein